MADDGLFHNAEDALIAMITADKLVTQKNKCVLEHEQRNDLLNRANKKGAEEISALKALRKKVLLELQTGFYCSKCKRSASEIVQQEKVSFEQHLQKVSGQPVPAPAELIKQRMDEFDAKIRTLEEGQARLTKGHEDLKRAAFRCYADAIRARRDYVIAQIWYVELKSARGRAAQQSSRRTYSWTETPTVKQFGLSNDYQILEPYASTNIYWKNGNVDTLRDNIDVDLEMTSDIRPSWGLHIVRGDGTSGNGVPFSAGYNGIVRSKSIGGRPFIELTLFNGNTLEFHHASSITIRSGQRVWPGDLIGITGRGEVALSITGRDRFGNPIDPRMAVSRLPASQLRLFGQIGRRLEYETFGRDPITNMRYADDIRFPKLPWDVLQ